MNQQSIPESVLVLLQGTSEYDHPGTMDGYRQAIVRGEVKWLKIFPVFCKNGVSRGKSYWDLVIEEARNNDVSLVVMEYYHSAILPDPTKLLTRLRRLPSQPLIASTLGDPFMNGYFMRPSIPKPFLRAAACSDLVAVTSMGKLASKIASFTKAPIILLPHGSCQVRFDLFAGEERSAENPDFDVLFIGSNNASRNPLRPFAWVGRKRAQLIKDLTRRFGRRFAVFGNGWAGNPSNQGPISFDQQINAARRSRVVVGGIPFSYERYYTSNRPFIQMMSGSTFVDVNVPGVDLLLEANKHWVLSPEEKIVQTVEQVLEWGDAKRREIGEAGARHVCQHHMQSHRVQSLLENIRRLRKYRQLRIKSPPYMPFFLPWVDLDLEFNNSTLQWLL